MRYTSATPLRLVLAIVTLLLGLQTARASFDIPTPEKSLWPETPQAAQLRRVTMPTPALATGAAQLDVPLYTLSVGGLELPFSLKYLSNGIRVEDDPYPVGYGWSLLPAFKITRQIRGRPDDQYAFVGDTAFISHMLLYNCMTNQPLNTTCDPEHDLYTVHLGSTSFNFMRDDTGTFRAPGHSDHSIRQEGEAFVVTDPEGRVWRYGTVGARRSDSFQIEWGLSSVKLPTGDSLVFKWEVGKHRVHSGRYVRSKQFRYRLSIHDPETPRPMDVESEIPLQSSINPSSIEFAGGRVDFSDGIGWDGSLHKAGTLEVAVTIDEDGLTTETYTDLRGLTLRVKRGSLATDYVYDGYGDLRYVLPPALTEKIKKGDSYTRLKPDMLGYAYWYDYDHRGLVTLRKLPGRDAVRYIYDPAGRLAAEQDGNSAPSLWTLHLYDRYGREVVTGNARWTDAMVKEYASKVRAFAYTGSSRAGGYSNAGYSPGMNEVFVSRRYNSKGQVFKEEGGGMTATYEYDTFGRVKKKVGVYPQVTVTEETSYTYSGKPSKTVASFSGCTVAIPTTTTLYTYDKADRLVKTETSLAGSADSSAVVVTAYDAVGRASSMRMGAAVTRTMDYDVHGWIDSTVTVVRRQSLTASGVLAASQPAAASFPFRAPGMSADIGMEMEQPMVTTLVERLLYAGGKNPCYNGNISSRIFPGGRYDYTYDALDRLTAAEFTPAAKGSKADYSTAYAYDPNGNLKSLSRKGVTDVSTLGEVFGLHDNITYTLTGNQVRGLKQEGAEGTAYGDRTGLGLDGIHTLDYDANGNLLSDSHRGIHSIAYNHLGQPSSIVLEDKSQAGKEGERIVNFYDPSGTKYKSSYLNKNGHGISTRLYAGPAVVEGGSLKMVRFPGGYFDADGIPHYYVTDYQGNVTHVVTRTGAIVQQTSYYPYGEPWREPTGTNRYLFGGKEREHFAGLNLSDFGPRFYNSTVGVWCAQDLESENLSYLSPYNYCKGNPIKFNDRTGCHPVYSPDGDFMGVDDSGFYNSFIILDPSKFQNGMPSKEAAGQLIPIWEVSEAVAEKIQGHYSQLDKRPDYDGIVTMTEGIAWAKDHPNALISDSPDDMLYMDASKLDFGDSSIMKFKNRDGSQENFNLYSASNTIFSAFNGTLRSTVYALGRVKLEVVNKEKRQVKIVNDEATDYDWNPGGSAIRDFAIRANNFVFCIDIEKHGFKVFYYGVETFNQ